MLCHAAVAVVQEKVQRHGGTLTRVITDDKGTRFLIAFGLPGRAHEDDEARAVLAALEISATLPRIALTGNPGGSPLGRGQRVSFTKATDLDSIRTSTTTLADSADGGSPTRRRRLGCATGITTGKVFCCEAGSNYRREYTLNGARVNLAARLMQAASKQGRSILVDSATFYGCAATEGACDFAELPAILVKGKDEPVEIWEPLQPAGAQAEAGTGGFAGAVGLTLSEGSSASVPASNMVGRPTVGTPRAPARPHAGVGKADRRGERDRRSAAQVLKGTLGRHHEMDRLRRCLAQLENEESTCTLLVGESGMGKTHLVGVLRALHAQANGRADPLSQVGLLLNASRPIEATTPFFLWRAIFERLFTTDTLRELASRSIDYGREPATPPIQGGGASATLLTPSADRLGADRSDSPPGAMGGLMAPATAASERHDSPAHQRSSGAIPTTAPAGSLPSSPGPRRHGRIFGGASGHGGLGELMIPKSQRARARSPERASLSSAPNSPKPMPSSPFRRFSRGGTESSRRSRGFAAATTPGAAAPLPPAARPHRPSPLGASSSAVAAAPSRSNLSVCTPHHTSSSAILSSATIVGGAHAGSSLGGASACGPPVGPAPPSGGMRSRILRGLRCSASLDNAPGEFFPEGSGKSRASHDPGCSSPAVSRDGSAGSLSGHIPLSAGSASGHVAPWGVRRPPTLRSPNDDEARPAPSQSVSASCVSEPSTHMPPVARPPSRSSSPSLRNVPSRILSHLSHPHHRRSNSTSPTRRWAAPNDDIGRVSERSVSRSCSKTLSHRDSRPGSSHALSPAASPQPSAANPPDPATGRAASSPLLAPPPGTVSSAGNAFGTGSVASYLGGLFGLTRTESFHQRESDAPQQVGQQRSQPFLQRQVSSPHRNKSPRVTLPELAMADAAPFASGRASLPGLAVGLNCVVPESRHPRQRWRDAVSTALAYTLPPHALGCPGSAALEGQVCIRPQVSSGPDDLPPPPRYPHKR
jgi:class 3 adenylate cyclase/energy-coupling factor transporter ATP-binding protein EcfA2